MSSNIHTANKYAFMFNELGAANMQVMQQKCKYLTVKYSFEVLLFDIFLFVLDVNAFYSSIFMWHCWSYWLFFRRRLYIQHFKI